MSKTIKVGSKVKIKNLDDETIKEIILKQYHIEHKTIHSSVYEESKSIQVITNELEVDKDFSTESEAGKILLGKKPGDVVTISKVKYSIVDVEN